MHVDLHIDESFSMNGGFNTSAKSIDRGQPAHSAQADLGRNFALLVYFHHSKRPHYLVIYLVKIKVE